MDRRHVLCGSLAVGLAEIIPTRSSSQACTTAQVNFPTFAAHYETQYQSEWCWAACISMIFNYHGHPVSQQRIVQEAYGGIANVPALSGFVIAQALNRQWQDDNGQPFSSQLVAAFDAQAGVTAINNAIVIQALSSGDPLLVGAYGHATVLTAASYCPTVMGPYVTGIGVFDPWPGRGARQLMPAEFTPPPMGGLLFLGLATINPDNRP